MPPDWSLLVDGACPSLLGLELIGQACAAWAASGGEGAEGVILRVRGLRLHVDALPVDAPLVAHLTRPDGASGTPGRLAAFHATLRDGEVDLVAGTLLVQRLDPREGTPEEAP